MLQQQHVSRLDVVWDEYSPESLKAETRSKRGKGVRRRVEPQCHSWKLAGVSPYR